MSDSDSSLDFRKKSRLIKKKDLEEYRNQRESLRFSDQAETQPKEAPKSVTAKHIFASDADALAAQLFGESEALAVPVESAAVPDEPSGTALTRPRSSSSVSGDSLDDFIYRDTRMPADDLGSEGGSEYDEDILDDIRDVFGDLRVLQLRDVYTKKPKFPSLQTSTVSPAIQVPVEVNLTDADLRREAHYLHSTFRPDMHDKSLWLRACVMFLRDWLVRGFGLQFIRRHLVSAKYFSVLTETQMEEIVSRLHGEWKELAEWSVELSLALGKFKELLENLPYEANSDVLAVVDVLELGRAVAHWSSVLDIYLEEPGTDFRAVLLSVNSSLSNYLDPLKRALVPGTESERVKLRRRDSTGIGVFTEIAKQPAEAAEKLVQLFSLLNCRPSDLGRVCAGQLGISGRGGFVSTAGLSLVSQNALSTMLSADFAFRMHVRHEILKRVSVYVVPLNHITLADPQYVHRRVLARPYGSLAGTCDFLEYQDLENRGEVRVSLAMTAGGVVAECMNSIEGVTPDLVGKHLWSCAQLHALKQAEMVGRGGEPIREEAVRNCLVVDPVYATILGRLLAVHELNAESDRGRVVQTLVRDALHRLYVEIYAELKQELLNQAELVVARRAADLFVAKVAKRGYFAENLSGDVVDNLGSRHREAVFRAILGDYAVASVTPEARGAIRVVIVNALGETVASEAFVFLLDRSGDRRRNDEMKKLSELLSEFKVAVVAVAADFEPFRIKLVTRVTEELVRASEDEYIKKVCKVLVVADVQVAGVSAELRGQSIGRFVQDPLAETLRLWSDTPDRNTLLSVTFHPLQHLVLKVKLQVQFHLAISRVVVELGSLDVIRMGRAPWRGSVLQFLPEMDAIKAEKLLKNREEHVPSGSGSESEQQRPKRKLAEVLDARTWQNVEPFLQRIPSTSSIIAALKETRSNLKTLYPVIRESAVVLGGLVLSKTEFLSAISGDSSTITETLGLPRDMWPLVNPLLAVITGSNDLKHSLFAGDLRARQAGVDLRMFVHDVLTSGDLPDYLKDTEIEPNLLEANAEMYLKHLVIEAVAAPYRSHLEKLHSLTEEQVFELQIGPGAFGAFGFLSLHRLRVVKDDGRWSTLRFVDLSIDASLKRPAGPVWTPNDRITARVVGLEPTRQQAVVSVEPPLAGELRELARLSPDTLVLKSDMAVYSSLGRELGNKPGASTGGVRVRRVIRHENYFADFDHSLALVKLKDASIGEVVFRPSKTKSNILIGMLKIKEPVDVARQDWVKVFQFSEEPSARNPNKIVYKLKQGGDGSKGEEFEEIDQIKAVLIERYLRYLADFKQHPRFRPETLEQVRNLVNAEFMTDAKGHVAYHFAVDERPEFAGSGVLLWCSQGTKVKEEPVTVTHRGFRLWNRGPFGTLNQLITWWKTEGFHKRSVFLAEWQAALSKTT